MLGKNIAIRGIFTTILLITLCFSQVSLEIANVDTLAGTLDIYMSNTAGCSYCADSTANFNSDDWDDKKEKCEEFSQSFITQLFDYKNISIILEKDKNIYEKNLQSLFKIYIIVPYRISYYSIYR